MKSLLLKDNIPTLSLAMEQEKIYRLVTFLQAGFYRQAEAHQSIVSFISDLPGFTEDYIANRLQTIFLNGDAIDQLDLPFSGPISTLALSAALPGLAGAIFRKNSPHAGLRKTSSIQKDSEDTVPVTVLVKLFNQIATEKGPGLLDAGVIIKTENLISFLSLRPSLLNAMTDLSLDGTPLSSDSLLNELDRQEEIHFICKPAND